MLDTDTASYALRGTGHVAQIVARSNRASLCISAITVAELRFGAGKVQSARLHQLIDDFIADIAVMPFDASCAEMYGKIALDLAERGTPIGELDALIAAHALALNVTLVTNNTRHFSRVRGLRLENWL
ncbi:MAG TPA: PIN domain-containing protein [Thermoanaerobaculia bacterium]|nr:PIN domain-containing protein [Thermoanaerobaculia bacterium]